MAIPKNENGIKNPKLHIHFQLNCPSSFKKCDQHFFLKSLHFLIVINTQQHADFKNVYIVS